MADVWTYDGVAWLLGLAAAETLYGSWGTGAGTAARDDTALFTEATEDREAAVVTQESTVQTDDTLVVSFTMTCNATPKTITEAGVFTAAVAGVMPLHSNFSGRALEEAEWIAFVMKLIGK